MKRRTNILTLGGPLALALFGTSLAGPLEDGEAAFQHHDYATALQILRPLAEKGNADAQINLGLMYAYGAGIPQDFAQARVWYRKAADQGYAEAQIYLGGTYAGGLGVPRDDAQAVVWYQKAADQGNAEAQTYLGDAYRNGRGVPQQTYEKALIWYRKAANQENAEAQTYLGWMYEEGAGAPKDYVRAHMWFNLAASRAELHNQAANSRDELAAKMTPAQIAEAQRLASEWKPTK